MLEGDVNLVIATLVLWNTMVTLAIICYYTACSHVHYCLGRTIAFVLRSSATGFSATVTHDEDHYYCDACVRVYSILSFL